MDSLGGLVSITSLYREVKHRPRIPGRSAKGHRKGIQEEIVKRGGHARHAATAFAKQTTTMPRGDLVQTPVVLARIVVAHGPTPEVQGLKVVMPGLTVVAQDPTVGARDETAMGLVVEAEVHAE